MLIQGSHASFPKLLRYGYILSSVAHCQLHEHNTTSAKLVCAATPLTTPNELLVRKMSSLGPQATVSSISLVEFGILYIVYCSIYVPVTTDECAIYNCGVSS